MMDPMTGEQIRDNPTLSPLLVVGIFTFAAPYIGKALGNDSLGWLMWVGAAFMIMGFIHSFILITSPPGEQEY